MTLPLTVTAERRAVDVADDATTYTFVGFPYGGPLKSETNLDGEDLHGTFFTQNTELGMEDRAIPVYWDHGVGLLGRAILGKAFLREQTEEGRLLEVVIDKANRYHNFLAELDDMGLLRGSGQALASMYGVDENTGELRYFHLGEYSLTVTPSNNLATTRSVFEKYGLVEPGEEQMPEDVQEPEEEGESHVDAIVRIFDEALENSNENSDITALIADGFAEISRRLDRQDVLIEELQQGQVTSAENIARLLPEIAAHAKALSGDEEAIYEERRHRGVARSGLRDPRFGGR